ncbi:MAG TPA: hypothetical protein VH640_03410 [Bryobacteraceae bacterium]
MKNSLHPADLLTLPLHSAPAPGVLTPLQKHLEDAQLRRQFVHACQDNRAALDPVLRAHLGLDRPENP